MSDKPYCINFWAPPGVGKSTTMASLFAILKGRGCRTEMATEFAKDMVYEKNPVAFLDQFYIMACQEYRLSRLIGQVDFIITDSPPMLCHVYARWADKHLVTRLANHYRDRYRNLDIRLERNPLRKHQTYGRKHTEAQSIELEQQVDEALGILGGPQLKVVADDMAAPKIVHWMQQGAIL